MCESSCRAVPKSNPSTQVRAPDGHPTLSTAIGDPLSEAIVSVNCRSAPGRSHCSSTTGRSSPTVACRNADARDSATSIRRTASGDRSQAPSRSRRAARTYCKASSCSRSDSCRRSRHSRSSSWRRSRVRHVVRCHGAESGAGESTAGRGCSVRLAGPREIARAVADGEAAVFPAARVTLRHASTPSCHLSPR